MKHSSIYNTDYKEVGREARDKLEAVQCSALLTELSSHLHVGAGHFVSF